MAEVTTYNQEDCIKGTFLVDVDDLPLVKQHKCHISSHGYATFNIIDRKKIYLHRRLAKATKGFVVDHVNRNKLDNRKSNLRLTTHTENVRNTDRKGYHYSKKDKKWVVQVTVGSFVFSSAWYENEEQAIGARHAAETVLRKLQNGEINVTQMRTPRIRRRK